jgi:hypothetical protein
MPRRTQLAKIHIISTTWFILCIGYLFISSLLQAGVKWWIVFSLSGPGALITIILISLYLFAMVRGISSSQKIQVEHPFTSTPQYAMFYVASPLLGGLAGCLLAIIDANTINQILLDITLGTLAMTFIVWVIVDPVFGLVEMLLPSSRQHYNLRIASARAERETKQLQSQRLLADVIAKAEAESRHWQELLQPEAEKLAFLLTTEKIDFKQAEREAISIGSYAWQTGGLNCMRELADMAISLSKKRKQSKDIVNYIPFWWNGIGSWRSSSFC